MKSGKRDKYRQSWTPSTLRQICTAIASWQISKHQAQQLGAVHRNTLNSALKRGGCVPDKMGRPDLMLDHERQRFVRFLLDRCDSNAPITRDAAGVLASELLSLRGVKFGTANGIPSETWWGNLHRDFPMLSLRTPSPLSFKALTSISVETTEQYFAVWNGVRTALNVTPDRTGNIDQCTIATNSKIKVFAARGQRRVRCVAAEHAHVSFQPLITADGRLWPCHVFVYKGKWPPYFTGVDQDSFELPADVARGLPDSAFLATSKCALILRFLFLNIVAGSGYHNDTSFLLALRHIVFYLDHVFGHDRDVFVIFLDQLGVSLTMEVTEFCRRNKIMLIFMPSNGTWCFQPLDLGCFRGFHLECKRLLAVLEGQRVQVNRHSLFLAQFDVFLQRERSAFGCFQCHPPRVYGGRCEERFRSRGHLAVQP